MPAAQTAAASAPAAAPVGAPATAAQAPVATAADQTAQVAASGASEAAKSQMTPTLPAEKVPAQGFWSSLDPYSKNMMLMTGGQMLAGAATARTQEKIAAAERKQNSYGSDTPTYDYTRKGIVNSAR